MFHEIIENDQGGLELWVERALVATVRKRDGTVDLVWGIRGPQDLDKARQTVMALPDLLVQYDLMLLRKGK